MAPIPERIAQYVIEGLIAEEGMGRVFKAFDPGLGRPVAIKMIRGRGDQEFESRFAKELKATAKLDHPNIVNVYGSGIQDGEPYLVMEFIDGASLEAIIGQGNQRITPLQKIGIMVDVCNGLQHAHDERVIHRDIKPKNIMVRKKDGLAKIVDFGIARVGDKSETQSGLIGTVEYMSPEQLRGEKLDWRTDIFSVGVVIYRLLSGSLPFPGETPHVVWQKILYEDPPPLDMKELNLPAELGSVVERALAKSRAARYESAREMALDLCEIQSKLKEDHARHYLTLADEAEQRRDWQRAFEHLQQVVKVDQQNSTARKRMSKVQEQLSQEQNVARARALKDEAGSAYREREYEKALDLIDQAVAIDASNPEWAKFRGEVLAARDLAVKLDQLLDQAERKLKDRKLAEADRVIQEALVLAPSNTQARTIRKFLDGLLLEEKRKSRLKELLDQAREQIRRGYLDDAEKTVAGAREVDLKSVEMDGLVAQLKQARDDEARVRELEVLRRQIDDDIAVGDFASAAKRAGEGLRRHPSEPSLKQVMRIIEQFDSAAAAKREEEEAQELARAASESAAQGRRILDREGADAAIRYLQELPQHLVQTPELANLVAAVRERHAAEQREAAELEQAVARARNWESRGQFPEALDAWRRLAESRPDVAEYRAEVKRLQRQNEPKPTTEQGSATKILSEGASEKRLIPATLSEPVSPSPKPLPPRKGPQEAQPEVLLPKKGETSLWRRPLVIYPAAAALILLGVLAVVWWQSGIADVAKPVTQSLTTRPSNASAEQTPPTESSPATPPSAEMGEILIRCKIFSATLTVGGINQGLIPSKGTKRLLLPVGNPKIRISAPGYKDFDQTISVQKGKLTEISADLVPISNSSPLPPRPKQTILEIKGDAGAMVLIGNEKRQIDADGTLTLAEPPGSLTIRVTKDGYTPESRILNLAEGQNTPVTIQLTRIHEPRIIRFIPGQSSIQAGQRVNLLWDTTNATSVEITPGGVGSPTDSGQMEVHPSETTTYTLTATGPGGSVTKTATVLVEAPVAKVPDVTVKTEIAKGNPPVRPSLPDQDLRSIKDAIADFEGAFNRHKKSAMQAVCKAMSKDDQRYFVDIVGSASQPTVSVNDCELPSLASDASHARRECEVLISTQNTNSKQIQRGPAVRRTFKLIKDGSDTWHIDGIEPSFYK